MSTAEKGKYDTLFTPADADHDGLVIGSLLLSLLLVIFILVVRIGGDGNFLELQAVKGRAGTSLVRDIVLMMMVMIVVMMMTGTLWTSTSPAS